jgi:hypothetical protein
LCTAGAVLGGAVAYAGVRALLALGASRLPRLDAVTFDTRVLLFALATLVVSGLLVGFAPALRLAGTDVRTLMNESTRSTTGGRGTARWLSVMTVVEIALAIMLVAGAGWLVRGFASLRNTDLGFAADKRLLFDVSFLGPKYPNGDAVRTASRGLIDRVAALPGVTGRRRDVEFPAAQRPRGLAHRAVPRRGGRPGASDRHPAARGQPGILRGDRHEAAAGARFRTDDRGRHDTRGDRQPDVREAVSPGRDPIGPAILGRLSQPRSAQRSNHHRSDRRRPAEERQR